MAGERGHRELQELLGAYALDAVEPDERLDLESHLRSCDVCRAEVQEHRETAAMLGATSDPAPDQLWSRIDSALESQPEPSAKVVPLNARRPAVWVRAAASVAAAAVIAVLGLTVARQDQRLDQLADAIGQERVVREANDALLDPERRVVQLRGQAGTVDVVVLPDGSGYVVRDTLQALPPSRTYQLWALRDGEAISAGVLGPNPDVRPFTVDPTIEALAITEERRGGARRPSTDPVVLGEISLA